jgi:hypothetical protein
MSHKTQLELEIEQQELDAQKKAAAKEKRDAAEAEKNRVWCRNKFREVTAPLVEWAGAEYTFDEGLKFTFRGEEYKVEISSHWMEGDNESGIPAGNVEAWYLYGRGKEAHLANYWSNFFPDRDGKWGYHCGPIKERVIACIKEIDEDVERDRHRRY